MSPLAYRGHRGNAVEMGTRAAQILWQPQALVHFAPPPPLPAPPQVRTPPLPCFPPRALFAGGPRSPLHPSFLESQNWSHSFPKMKSMLGFSHGAGPGLARVRTVGDPRSWVFISKSWDFHFLTSSPGPKSPQAVLTLLFLYPPTLLSVWQPLKAEGKEYVRSEKLKKSFSLKVFQAYRKIVKVIQRTTIHSLHRFSNFKYFTALILLYLSLHI